MNNTQQQQLLKKAAAAMRRAYAPYSKFCVGAAIRTREGRVFQGCNVENASYGLTICAERTALGAAVAAGHRHFKALAIVSSGRVAPMPCGACLQVLAEFCPPDFIVITAAAQNPASRHVYSLKDLLPRAFTLESL